MKFVIGTLFLNTPSAIVSVCNRAVTLFPVEWILIKLEIPDRYFILRHQR